MLDAPLSFDLIGESCKFILAPDLNRRLNNFILQS